MFYIPKIYDYFKILTDEKVKDFVAIKFGEYFNSIIKEESLREVAKLLYIFLTKEEEYVESNSSGNCIHRYNVETLNLFIF